MDQQRFNVKEVSIKSNNFNIFHIIGRGYVVTFNDREKLNLKAKEQHVGDEWEFVWDDGFCKKCKVKGVEYNGFWEYGPFGLCFGSQIEEPNPDNIIEIKKL